MARKKRDSEFSRRKPRTPARSPTSRAISVVGEADQHRVGDASDNDHRPCYEHGPHAGLFRRLGVAAFRVGPVRGNRDADTAILLLGTGGAAAALLGLPLEPVAVAGRVD